MQQQPQSWGFLPLVAREGLTHIKPAEPVGVDYERTYPPMWPQHYMLDWDGLCAAWRFRPGTGQTRINLQVIYSMPMLLAAAYSASGGHSSPLGKELHIVIAGARETDTDCVSAGLAITAFGPWAGVMCPVRFSFVGPEGKTFRRDVSKEPLPIVVEGVRDTIGNYIRTLKRSPRLVVLASPGLSAHLHEWLAPGELGEVFERSIPLWMTTYSTMDLLEDAALWRMGGGTADQVLPTPWWSPEDTRIRPWMWLCRLGGRAKPTPEIDKALKDVVAAQAALRDLGMSFHDFDHRILGMPMGDWFVLGPLGIRKDGAVAVWGQFDNVLGIAPVELAEKFAASDNMIGRYQLALAILRSPGMPLDQGTREAIRGSAATKLISEEVISKEVCLDLLRRKLRGDGNAESPLLRQVDELARRGDAFAAVVGQGLRGDFSALDKGAVGLTLHGGAGAQALIKWSGRSVPSTFSKQAKGWDPALRDLNQRHFTLRFVLPWDELTHSEARIRENIQTHLYEQAFRERQRHLR